MLKSSDLNPKKRAWGEKMRQGPGMFLTMQIRSEANMREHWATKYRRSKEQKTFVTTMMTIFGFHWRGLNCPPPPYSVILTRYGPKPFDDDNLARAFKSVRDAVASCLKVNDGDSTKISFITKQEKSPYYGVRIEIREV